MIEYIYFVKCPNCEDEHFYFFDEAKEFAMNCLSDKPIITQTEVNRNDFGECVDSNELGTIWSWEDAVTSIPKTNELTFSKEDTFDNPDFESEFSDDDIVFETDCIVKDEPKLIFLDEDFKVGDEVFCKVNKKSGTVKDISGDIITVEFTGGEDPDRIDTYYKADLLPPIKKMVEAMEENEDEIECAWCNELFPKADCTHTEHNGWLCDYCADDVVECTWCEELYDKSSCRYEVNLGWLCNSCVGAIKSRGETLTFTEELKETVTPKREFVDFEYDALETTVCGPKRDVDDWDEFEVSAPYTYSVDKDDVATDIYELFLTEEDVADVPGGLDALEDDEVWSQYITTHFDDLLEKYYNELLNHYKRFAQDEFESEYTYGDYVSDREAAYGDMEYDRWKDERFFDESVSKATKSKLEELEDRDVYRERLIDCPECGEKTFDAETYMCINCGFN